MRYCQEPCCTRRPTHLIRYATTGWAGSEFADGYCTEHMAQARKDVKASGVRLISVTALPPVKAAARSDRTIPGAGLA